MIDTHELEPEVLEAINRGRKIDAIKRLTLSRNIGLKEAKDIIDQYIDNNMSDEHVIHRSGNSNRIINLIILALLFYGFYVFLVK